MVWKIVKMTKKDKLREYVMKLWNSGKVNHGTTPETLAFNYFLEGIKYQKKQEKKKES